MILRSSPASATVSPSSLNNRTPARYMASMSAISFRPGPR